MASTFTTITTGTDLQFVGILNEIIEGINERGLFLYEPTPPEIIMPVMVGDDIQAVSFWYNLQNTVYSIATQFCDPTVDPTNTTGLEFWTVGEWLDYAGLPSGFRAATSYPGDWTRYNDPAFVYRFIREGDIIGPWLYVDLQKGLNALTRTKKRANMTNGGALIQATGNTTTDCVQAVYNGVSAYTSAGIEYVDTADCIELRQIIEEGGNYTAYSMRKAYRPKVQVFRHNNDIAYDIKVFGVPTGDTWNTTSDTPSIWSYYGWTRADNLKWKDVGESDTGVITATWQASKMFQDLSNPAFAACPLAEDLSMEHECPVSGGQTQFLSIEFWAMYDVQWKYHL